MQILMATAATEIKPVSEPELVSNILAINQDNLNSPHNCETIASREPLPNAMETLAILPKVMDNPSKGYGQSNQYIPAYASAELNEKLDCLEIVDEAPALISPPCNNRSQVRDSKLYNDNNNSFKLAEDMKLLKPQMLFTENEQTRETQNYIRQDSYTQTNEDRVNSHQAASNVYTDLNGIQYHRNINFTAQECPDSINIPYKFSDVPPRRYAWGNERQSYLTNEGGYNSDSDILRNRNKKSSFDGPCGSYEKKSPEFRSFEKGHRRVRSGDAPMLNITTNNNGARVPSNMRNMQYAHSQSQGSIQHQMQSRLPTLNQSISVDCASTGNTQIHEHLCLQSTTFVNLQAAITEATKEFEQLEKDVDSKLHELNVGLSVEHRTHKDCKLVEEEIKELRNEIQAMYDECDQSGVQVPGDPPAMANNRRISDLYPTYSDITASPSGSYPGSPPGITQVYPVSPNSPLCPAPITPPCQPPITVQPGKRQKSRESGYENIPDYPRTNTPRNDPPRNDPAGQTSPAPPPIPPRQPMQMMIDMKPANEQWRCPACTFDNLLVSNCEICLTPRPCVLRNNIQR